MLKRLKKTEKYLRASIEAIPEIFYERECEDYSGTVKDCIDDAKEFLDHNEFGLAYDNLCIVACEHSLDNDFHINMEKAAQEMGFKYELKNDKT